MKRSVRLFALIAVAALSLQAFAHDKKAHGKGKAPAAKTVKSEFLGKGDGVKTCPVSGEEITSKDFKGRFFNRVVYFCCAECLAQAKQSPALYVKRTQAAQIAATRNLPKIEGHHDGHGDHHAQDPKEGEKQAPKEGEKQEPKEGEKQDSKAGCLRSSRTSRQPTKPNPEKQDSKDGEKKFLGKGDGIETCPVMGSPVNKEVKHEVNGRVFYVCCPGCAEVVKKNPDLYLKPVEGDKKPDAK